jgi:hypothetical protein
MTYTPNRIPKSERKWNLILSAVLIVIGSIILVTDDLYIPLVRPKNHFPTDNGVHFHGKILWFIFAAFIAAASNMISVVLDHYDKRNNERNYRLFAMVSEAIGWSLLFLGLFLEALVFQEAEEV